jgi:hypothetical protein
MINMAKAIEASISARRASRTMRVKAVAKQPLCEARPIAARCRVAFDCATRRFCSRGGLISTKT